MNATFSSIATLLVSYPFDLAHARLTADMSNKKTIENTTTMKALSMVSNPEGNHSIM